MPTRRKFLQAVGRGDPVTVQGAPRRAAQRGSFGDGTPRPLNPYAVAILPGRLSGCLLVTGGLRHNNLTKQPKSPAPGIFPAVPRCFLLAQSSQEPVSNFPKGSTPYFGPAPPLLCVSVNVTAPVASCSTLAWLLEIAPGSTIVSSVARPVVRTPDVPTPSGLRSVDHHPRCEAACTSLLNSTNARTRPLWLPTR